MRGEAQKFGIPARRARIMAAHALAELHESVLDMARMLVVVQVFADLLVGNLASEPGVPPKAERVNRINYEICVLQSLRERLRCKEVWVVGAERCRNPDDDLPADFAERRDACYERLGLPRAADAFIAKLKAEMTDGLDALDRDLPRNPKVKLKPHRRHPIVVTPLEPQPEPPNLKALKVELGRRWPMTGLLDILKEADLRIGFTDAFATAATREATDRGEIRRRLLFCLYGLGTNAGLKRLADGRDGFSYKELLHTRRHYIDADSVRDATRRVVNATLAARLPQIWGEGTTACASDSKQFGAFDQNLMTEWHVRYGGRGVMIYWHVERQSVCIHSQLKRCSSSEVAAMIEGVLRHGTEMEVEKTYVDSHGQSEVAFAFCRLLGFELLPRLKAIASQRLYLPVPGTASAYPNLECILTRPIDWELIAQQYDEMVRYATALAERTADPEAILRRFTRSNVQHPTYRALAELGKAVKTIFLCEYLRESELRRKSRGAQRGRTGTAPMASSSSARAGEIATNHEKIRRSRCSACISCKQPCLRQHADDPARLAEPAWMERDRGGFARADAAHLRARQSVRRIPARHDQTVADEGRAVA